MAFGTSSEVRRALMWLIKVGWASGKDKKSVVRNNLNLYGVPIGTLIKDWKPVPFDSGTVISNYAG